ncbi:MAG: hypothetical protein IJ773_01480 [Lachnospiraceae bacterium]|nr:hypothetical protein [Lachnospiraceae bacterium]
MTTALLSLCCIMLGMSLKDHEEITIGRVNNLFNESSRDSIEWNEEARQFDFDRLEYKKHPTVMTG